ncbi:acyl-CoA carboxylase subunit epsilon [Streptomyces fulvoviolaceus]|uniref:acyl-CoA carboxylase subunit epsilon n=1 Tax=Streptomyces fulvoviolaceus TaxID=285535 RepID=UPI0004C76805|nr:acyl-CoA carboxylase subunit epsilon [Streptomyces fulvoviolaceus]MCT9084613.1 acyl-CoA carboxylase subunit epsilon [Streptomyces fulvoviolaceus]
MTSPASTTSPSPAVRIVRGTPSATELAAVLAVLTIRTTSPTDTSPRSDGQRADWHRPDTAHGYRNPLSWR